MASGARVTPHLPRVAVQTPDIIFDRIDAFLRAVDA